MTSKIGVRSQVFFEDMKENKTYKDHQILRWEF